MAKMSSADIDGFNTMARLIRMEFTDCKKRQDEYIKSMYRILKKNDYTRTGAINTIYTTIANELNSLIEVRKTHIENITKQLD